VTATSRKEKNNPGPGRTRTEKLASNVESKVILPETVAILLAESVAVVKESRRNVITVEELDIFLGNAPTRRRLQVVRNATSVIKKDILPETVQKIIRVIRWDRNFKGIGHGWIERVF
jgi:hypothetical protein